MTSSRLGTAAVVLPALLAENRVEIAGIVLNRGILTAEQRKRLRVRKLRKILSIGVLGALNGVRMRRWYADASKLLGAKRIDEQARNHNIPLLEVDNLQSPELKPFVESMQCEVGLSLGNGYIPRSVFSLTPLGMVNIHHEVLPTFRGAQSVIWQLYEGYSQTGFTIHRIDASIDTGAIILVEKMPIIFGYSIRETVTKTYAELIRRSGLALARVLSDSESIESAVIQSGGTLYTTPSGFQFLRILMNHYRLRSINKL